TFSQAAHGFGKDHDAYCVLTVVGLGRRPYAYEDAGLYVHQRRLDQRKDCRIRSNVNRLVALGRLDDEVAAVETFDGTGDAGGLLDLSSSRRRSHGGRE